MTVAVVDPTVDSLNPFTSIYRLPTQIHRLMYDYLTMYSAEDATPTEGLAESWDHSGGRAHVDLHDPRRLDVLRR